MKYAICEDEELFAQQVADLLHQTDPTILVKFYPSGEALLFALAEETFDGVFLDIQLAGTLNGMEVARQIRRRDHELPLIFLSNYAEYVFDGYDVGALGYIMKPLTVEKLTKILAKLQRQPAPTLLVATKEELVKLPLFSILYFEVAGHELTIVAQERNLQLKGTLESFAPELTEDFMTIHRAFKVNLAHIVKLLDKSVIMSNGAELPVARGRKKALKSAFLAYYRRTADEN